MDELAWLRSFVKESNKIEGIHVVREREVEAHAALLMLDKISVDTLERFVDCVQPGARLRDKSGMDVRVGQHVPPAGGPEIRGCLETLLDAVNGGGEPYEGHRLYETLHPFMDGNGRSGRALWLWQMNRAKRAAMPMQLGFLHSWYYQSLSATRS